MARTDIVIIGGGSIGLNAAYYLLKAGRSVTLLDQAEIGMGSSSGNAGQIVPSHIIPLAAPGIISTALRWLLLDAANSPFGMKLSLDPAYLAWLIHFARACSAANVRRGIPPLTALGLLSAQNYARMIAEEGFDCHYSEAGVLFLYQTEAALKSGRHEIEVLHRHGVPAEVLDQAAVHQREPMALPGIIGGIHFSGDSSISPARFLHLLAERVRAMGADLRPGTPVTRIESAGGAITRVVTPAGELEPAQVVLAAGAWSPLVARSLGLKIPVQPARGYSMTMAAPPVVPRQALLLAERRVAVTPMGDQLRFTGRLEVGNMSTKPEPKYLAQIERAVREYITLDARLDIQEKWAGLRPTTPDGMPIIGVSPRHKNLIVATGHAMLGLGLGPGSGQLVAEITNRAKPAFDIAPLRVERFKV